MLFNMTETFDLTSTEPCRQITCEDCFQDVSTAQTPELFDELITPDVLEAIEFSFECVLINVFALLGLVCTSVTLAVLSRHNITKDSSNILLVSLSVADFLFCLTIPVSRSKCLLSHMFTTSTALKIHIFIFEYFSEISRVFFNCSITMVGVICTQRFLVVFFPFRSAQMLTPFRMKLASVSVYVVNFLLFSPAYFSFTHDYVFSERYGDTVPVLRPTEFYRDNFDALNIEMGIVYGIAVLGTSLLLTLILTPAIAVRLWMVTSRRSKLTHRKCNFEPHVAKVLVTVCSMSFAIYGPLICYEAAIVFLPQYSVLTRSFQVFLIITNFCGTICASVNFLIYITMSYKFRQKYKMLVYKLCLSKFI